jgi:hypothetical protein
LRKYAAILFLFALILPFTGTYLWLQHQKTLVQKQVKKLIVEGIAKEDLILLRFTREELITELDWKHAEEFEYSGQLYDIVETKAVGDSVYLWCFWDKRETQFNQRLKELVAYALGNNKQNKEKQDQLFNFLNDLYFQRNSAWVLSSPDGCITHALSYIEQYSSLIIPPPTPPPRAS